MSVGEKFVRYALKIGAIEIIPEGRKLKSGRLSPYFFNAGIFLTGAKIHTLGCFYTERAAEGRVVPEVILGPAYKGIPLAISMAMAFYAHYGQEVGWAFNRKEAKDHGEGGLIVGTPLKDRKVLIVDDVITSGETKSEAASLVWREGGQPTHCFIAFDRQERGLEGELSAAQLFTKKERIPVVSIATLDDLIMVLMRREPEHQKYAAALPLILAYRDQYGVS